MEQLTGTYTISELIAARRPNPRPSVILAPAGLCMLAGAFTKSAQFPFHFWLPNAMSAPTPISAFLHSATMVKAGIYLLARLHPVMGSTTAWMTALVVVGAVTAVWGATAALAQTDLKRMLAHTTIMALGIITMFLGGQDDAGLDSGHHVPSGSCPLQIIAFHGGRCHRSSDRYAGNRSPWRDWQIHAVYRRCGAAGNIVHGGISVVSGFYRKGDHVQGGADRNSLSRPGHDCRAGLQCVDGCSGGHPGPEAILGQTAKCPGLLAKRPGSSGSDRC